MCMCVSVSLLTERMVRQGTRIEQGEKREKDKKFMTHEMLLGEKEMSCSQPHGADDDSNAR